MRKRRLIGAFTFLSGFPGLGAILLFALGSGDMAISLMMLTISAVCLRGLAGTVGGVLIWKGNKLGYYLTAVAWLYMVVAGCITLVQLHTSDIIIPSFELNQINHAMYLKPLSRALGKVLWGLPILFIVIRDLFFSDYRQPLEASNNGLKITT